MQPVAPLRLDERLDHRMLLRLLADPAVGEDGHARLLTEAMVALQLRDRISVDE